MQKFQSNVTGSEFKDTLFDATEQIARNPNKALNACVSLLFDVAEPMKTTFVIRRGKSSGSMV